ncbi:acetylornithine transaminase [Salsipaludibacter albus]|uniref:acetylornithine transaminase n=1 Tax=Salsipaludibacter albus TaxID=2849650 RepID=UPI001EE4D3A4|nr:acetylornithine transaminase [Salsipaludibacter albus]MBY5163795.1 acetylornithine transaminase [Salsipaludibacter albus]
MSTTSSDLSDATAAAHERDAAHVMGTYARRAPVFVRGQGTVLFDADGDSWLDFLGGLAVTVLGHSHPAVAGAVREQVGAVQHTSNLFLTEPMLGLAERLARITGWDDARTFFANCGATANEAAIKLARRHGKAIADDKVRMVTLDRSFHGRTFATLEATGQPEKHAPFAPLLGYVDTVPFDDPEALTAAVTDQHCAVMLEVVQGEGGVRPLDPAVLSAARAACDAHDALLIVDEVQTGMGRLGEWFGFQTTDVVPDVITLAKALANGLPIGACVAHGAAADVFGPGDHATTFGGNPVTAAAANAVIDTIEGDGLLTTADVRSRRLTGALDGLAQRHDLVAGWRGRGLLLGVELTAPVARHVEQAAEEGGLIVNAVADDVVRMAPPLTVSNAEIATAITTLTQALDTALATHDA